MRLRHDKFPVLKILRDKEATLLRKGGKPRDRDLASLREEIDEVEGQIRTGLAQAVLGRARAVDRGLDAVARLDGLFARAGFGARRRGAVPIVDADGVVAVDGFRHPVLAAGDGAAGAEGGKDDVVPVDLRLGNGRRALVLR